MVQEFDELVKSITIIGMSLCAVLFLLAFVCMYRRKMDRRERLILLSSKLV